jgi:hypothetical protein
MKTSESLEQARFFAWVKKHMAAYPIFSIPNGGHRTATTAARMKMEGLVPGVPDIFVAVAPGLFIEMKAEGGRLSEAQKTMIGRLREQGYAVAVCEGCAEAQVALIEYLEGDRWPNYLRKAERGKR